jgi:AhpD family alkylhydroperoxidase
MTTPDAPSRAGTSGAARTVAVFAFAAAGALNGAIMLLAPAEWYAAVPGVAVSGPFNAHLVRDVGAAFLAVSLPLIVVVAGLPGARRVFALPALIFLGLHALVHAAEVLDHGVPDGAALAVDVLGVYLPAAVILALVLRPRRTRLPAALAEGLIRAGEQRLGVALPYLREVARLAPATFARLGQISGLGAESGQAPRDLAHLAALGAVAHDDCGECLQIHVNLARRDGVPAAVLKAALAGRFDELPPALAGAFRFGRATAANDPELARWAGEIEAALGRGVLIDLSFAVALARFHPSLKRGMGLARSCALIDLDWREAA